MKRLKLNQIWFFLLLVVLITLPFSMIANNIAIALLAVVSLFFIDYKRVVNYNFTLFFPVIFALSALSLSYNCDVESGLKSLEKIMVFPLFYFLIPGLRIDKTQFKKINLTFALAVTLGLVYCFLYAFHNVISTESLYIYNPATFVNENFFKYHRFSSAIGMHAIYLSIYTLFSLLIIIRNRSFLKTWQLIIWVAFLLLSMFLLNSFAVLFAGLALFSLYMIFTSKIKKFGIYLLPIFLVIAGWLFYAKGGNFQKDFYQYEMSAGKHSGQWNSVNERLAKWECGLQATQSQLPLGTGVGCEQPVLNQVYKERNFKLGLMYNFSTHNQYIDYALSLGIPGVIAYFSFLIWGLISAIKQRKMLLFSILSILMIVSITENVLTLNKGIVFFALFILFLQYHEET